MRLALRRIVHGVALGCGAFTVLAVASPSCGGGGADLPTARDSGVDSSFTLPDFDVGNVEFYDSLSGRVARRLLGCSNPSEPNCHLHEAGGMLLFGDPKHDLAQIIEVQSHERPDLKRIHRFDAAHSWLFLKVSANFDAGVESPMPLGNDGGDPVFAALVAEWVAAGAPNDYEDSGVAIDADADSSDAGDLPDADADVDGEPVADGD